MIIILRIKKNFKSLVHFKNIYETAQAMESMHFQNSTKSLNDITSHHRRDYNALPCCLHKGGLAGLPRPHGEAGQSHDPGRGQELLKNAEQG